MSPCGITSRPSVGSKACHGPLRAKLLHVITWLYIGIPEYDLNKPKGFAKKKRTGILGMTREMTPCHYDVHSANISANAV